ITSSDELPDVILLDINMPVMDGWQFLDEFVKIKPLIKKKITIYMVSSSIDEADLERAKTYEEVSDFIVKPVKAEDLEKMLS
ncbi:MAG: response regulator, partial [Imperialibacter sp.]